MVKTYIATKGIREVDKVQRDIVALYKEDFSQYESEDKKLKLISIYDIIPAELNKQNKKFQFGELRKSEVYSEVKEVELCRIWKRKQRCNYPLTRRRFIMVELQRGC